MGEAPASRGSLYDKDVHAWACDQAARLRRLADLKLPEADDIDFEHVIEEIESLAEEQVYQASTNLIQALNSLIKVAVLPGAPLLGADWRREVLAGLHAATDRTTSSMKQVLDMEAIWRKAGIRARRDLQEDGLDLSGVPSECPFALDTLLSPDTDLASLIATMSQAMAPGPPGPGEG